MSSFASKKQKLVNSKATEKNVREQDASDGGEEDDLDSVDGDSMDEDESGDDEGDEEEDMSKLPRIFYDYALEQLEVTEVHTAASYAKIIAALKKSRNLILESNADLKTLLEKASKRKTGDTKVPPGSALVQRNINDTRYLLCLVDILLSKIYHLQYDSSSSVACLREALIWFPRSIEGNYLLGEELRGHAGSASALGQCEAYYVKAVETGVQLAATTKASSATAPSQLQAHLSSKLGKDVSSTASAAPGSAVGLSAEEQEDADVNQILLADELCHHKKAVQSLILYYCQSGRNNDAFRYLVQNGYRLKLSSQVLQYQLQNAPASASTASSASAKRGEWSQYVSVIDEAVDRAVLTHLRQVFRPESPFWSEHQYDTLTNASRSVGYFSYLYPMRDRAASNSMEQIIDAVYPLVCQQFPHAAEATVAEWWVHSRPHINGHQLHFDSDETRIQTGAGKVQHPIVSCVLFVTADVGGPTLVTNQRITGDLATKGWLAYPQSNRLVTFDANFLHGVIPGRDVNPSVSNDDKGSSNSGVEARRLTFMIGFWKSISAKCRGKDAPGPGQPFPNPADTRFTWPLEMGVTEELSRSTSSSSTAKELRLVEPVEISSVWESVEAGVDAAVLAKHTAAASGSGASASRESANYNTCFQGF